MRTPEEIKEAVRIMKLASVGAGQAGNDLVQLMCEAQGGVLKWVLGIEPYATVFQQTIEACQRQDKADQRHASN